MSSICCIGVATLDVICRVDHYPHENEELRAQSRYENLGGNATNTAYVLKQLGHHVELIAALADDQAARFIQTQLQTLGIGTRHCPIITPGHTPISYIIQNAQNGSRTIVHHRQLPELSAVQLEQVPWQEFDWFHFEGRAVTETERILHHLLAQRTDQPISIEIEKPREAIQRLYGYADVLLFSRRFVQHLGFTQANDFLTQLHRDHPQTILICAWGEDGAYACDRYHHNYHAAAQPPLTVVDTTGAGDTFNAAVIDALCSGRDLAYAVQQGCVLAGKKVGQQGLANLI